MENRKVIRTGHYLSPKAPGRALGGRPAFIRLLGSLGSLGSLPSPPLPPPSLLGLLHGCISFDLASGLHRHPVCFTSHSSDRKRSATMLRSRCSLNVQKQDVYQFNACLNMYTCVVGTLANSAEKTYQLGTVLPRSTSTTTRLPSTFLPSALLYASFMLFLCSYSIKA